MATLAIRLVGAAPHLVFGLVKAAMGTTRTAVEGAFEALRQLPPLIAESRELVRAGTTVIHKADEIAERVGDRLGDVDVDQLRALVGKATEAADVVAQTSARFDVERLVSLMAKAEQITDLLQTRASEVDVEALLGRLRRVEQALLNTETGTLNLVRSVEGSIESMPNFVSKRAKRERQKVDPIRPPAMPSDTEG